MKLWFRLFRLKMFPVFSVFNMTKNNGKTKAFSV